MRGKELHEYILSRVKQRLGSRSWRWLADRAGVPRTTLVTQASRPKFSVDVLVSVARALDRDVGHFLPGPADEQPSDVEVKQALEVLVRHLSEDE